MIESTDAKRLSRLMADVRALETAEVLEAVAGPHLDQHTLAEMVEECVFDHAALLLFPDHVTDVTESLHKNGFEISGRAPSVVVRERLARRYGLVESDLDVSILHASIKSGQNGVRGLEVFCLPRDQVARQLITRERQENNESHLALKVRSPDDAKLRKLRSIILGQCEMRADGGGYNPYDDIDNGGRSVLYFASRSGRRLELTCTGDFREVVAMQRRGSQDERYHLLTILTGPWAARAVYVAAKLGIADVLYRKSLPAPEIARLLNADAEATARLLRYLNHLGVLRRESSSCYALDAIGELLRAENSFRDLVLLYGEEFYQAWEELPQSVRRGKSAFGITFGAEHFDYFARHPESARRFDRSMSAVSKVVADEITAIYDFSASSSVVDVGGGSGLLLQRVLRENPAISGILVDRPHVCDRVVVEPELAGRMTTRGEDFFASVPAGHGTYLLVRVLHDWDDDDSTRILEVCRAACGPDSTLLIVERLMPEDDGTSLAVAWDMQMLAITGGRERTRAEYGRLLYRTGFVLQEVRDLPLDLHVLVSRPRSVDDRGVPEG